MKIFIHRNGKQFGPYSPEEMNRHLADGTMSPRDSAWRKGLADWIPLAEIEGIIVPDESGQTAPSTVREKSRSRLACFADALRHVQGTGCFGPTA